MKGTAAKLRTELGNKISTFTFDYSKWAADWPTNANIAPCLGEYINQVSAAYKKVGGDGKVILVAHSMGGIAIQYASSAEHVQHPITAAVAPLIITLDTPYLGSPWGGSSLALGKELFGAVLGKSVPNPFGTDGSACLQPHPNGQRLPSQCGGLPPWLPGGTTLDEIGGNITIRRTLLGVHLYDIETGSDGIVTTSSSVGYRTSGPGGTAPVVSSATAGTTLHSQYANCSVTTGQIHNALTAPGGVLSSALGTLGVSELSDWAVLQQIQNGQDTPAVQLYSAAALLTAGCSHIKITDDANAITQVANDVDNYIKAHPALAAIQVGFTGIGLARIGTSMDQFAAALEARLTDPNNDASGGTCWQGYVTGKVAGHDLSLGVLAEEGRSGPVRTYELGLGPPTTASRALWPTTAAGVGLGSTTDQVRAAYPGRVKSSPHLYVPGGQYLQVDQGAYSIVFETNDTGRVTAIRAGQRPEVLYEEGCA